ncbi:hypothetical protein MPTK1_5g18100 [Marchantia polymorpha subsp. ruderalis]|uniref:Uncharacterized protein n=2 Tax=Marchantia polymorpha TaxID=3197 RepID=A0AAF6BJK8_MARPO|nr:hypothetical protein MARPO_0084s0057 [Marchantia polymorpha]BBN12192.1 hypothetical protein Mp_5g18100 [Marchantia polymorpha subsp. ruderalis]|eukprot:PTQ33978.1 hypothetical protein MARPO_0084s0057 [Marchantia polymorpha]
MSKQQWSTVVALQARGVRRGGGSWERRRLLPLLATAGNSQAASSKSSRVPTSDPKGAAPAAGESHYDPNDDKFWKQARPASPAPPSAGQSSSSSSARPQPSRGWAALGIPNFRAALWTAVLTWQTKAASDFSRSRVARPRASAARAWEPRAEPQWGAAAAVQQKERKAVELGRGSRIGLGSWWGIRGWAGRGWAGGPSEVLEPMASRGWPRRPGRGSASWSWRWRRASERSVCRMRPEGAPAGLAGWLALYEE